MIQNKYYLLLLIPLLAGCDNPGGVSDAKYAEYQQLAPPKILYSCKTFSPEVLTPEGSEEFSQCNENAKAAAGSDKELEMIMRCLDKAIITITDVAYGGGLINYNFLLTKIKEKCPGELAILEQEH